MAVETFDDLNALLIAIMAQADKCAADEMATIMEQRRSDREARAVVTSKGTDDAQP